MKDFRNLNLLIKFFIGFIVVGLVVILIWFLFSQTELINQKQKRYMSLEEIILPQPEKISKVSIEEALLERRSVREYKDEPLKLKEVSQILWAAQGITEPTWGGRTAPSAGGLYPLELYLVVKKVENLEPGLYHYLPQGHKLTRVLEGNINEELAAAGLNQSWIRNAPINLVITAFYSRTINKYGERGIRYVHLEAGHAAQNVYLQAQSLGLGTVTVGAFDDDEIRKLLNLSEEETPLYIMPIGRK
ncbi:MAG: SagB/ThcOx family dehydrogenase [bacterium]|nr:SagB/ThcOx family dehydrogenase [bacterium]